MAFIKNSEREKLVKKTNQSYGLRKFIITAEIILLLAFIAVTIVSAYFTSTWTDDVKPCPWAWFEVADGKIVGLSVVGWAMFVAAIIVAALGITSLILTWTLKSPKDTRAKMDKLASSALSGKRASKKTAKVVRSRTSIEE